MREYLPAQEITLDNVRKQRIRKQPKAAKCNCNSTITHGLGQCFPEAGFTPFPGEKLETCAGAQELHGGYRRRSEERLSGTGREGTAHLRQKREAGDPNRQERGQ